MDGVTLSFLSHKRLLEEPLITFCSEQEQIKLWDSSSLNSSGKKIPQTYLLIIVSLSRESFQVTTQGSVIRNPVCEPCVLSVRVTVTSADSYIWFCGLSRRKRWSLALFTTVDSVYFVSKQIFFCLHSSWNLITTLFAFQFSDIPADLLFKFWICFCVFLLPAVCYIPLIWFTEFCLCVAKLFGCETMHAGSCGEPIPEPGFCLGVCALALREEVISLGYIKGVRQNLNSTLPDLHPHSPTSSFLHSSSAAMHLLLTLLGAVLSSLMVSSEVQPQADFNVQAVRQMATLVCFSLQYLFL